MEFLIRVKNTGPIMNAVPNPTNNPLNIGFIFIF
jgi:hypothetical protein